MATGPVSSRSDTGYISSVPTDEASITKDLGQLSMTVPESGEISGPKFAPGGPSVTDGSGQTQTSRQAGKTCSSSTQATGADNDNTADIHKQESAEGQQTAHVDQSSVIESTSEDVSPDAEPEGPLGAGGSMPGSLTAGVTAKPEQREQEGEMVPGGSHPPVPISAHGEVPKAKPADDDIPDEDVPIVYRLPQIDFIILAAKLDEEKAEQFMKDVLRSEEDKVTGVLYNEKFVKVGGDLESIHSFQIASVSHNYQRATFVLPYITEALFDQKEARHFLYNAIHHLITNEDRSCSVIPLWVCAKNKIEDFARKCPEKRALAGVLLPLNGVACDRKREITNLKLLLKGSSGKKAKRCKVQKRERDEWKRLERIRREEKKRQQQKEDALSPPVVSSYLLSYEEPGQQLLGGVWDKLKAFTKPFFGNTEGFTKEQYEEAMKHDKLGSRSQLAASNKPIDVGSRSATSTTVPTPQEGKNQQMYVHQIIDVNIQQVPSEKVPASHFFLPGALGNDSTSASELDPQQLSDEEETKENLKKLSA